MLFSNAVKNLKIPEYQNGTPLLIICLIQYSRQLWNSETIQALLLLKVWIMNQDLISVGWVLKMSFKKLRNLAKEKLVNQETSQSSN